jgi:hypothetical protein
MGIKLKRSAVASKAPVVADLELGELAVNTWDGKLYLKKSDGTEAIVEVGPVRSVAGRTGAVTLAIADVASLQAALDGKQAAGSYAAAAHTHAISSVTGLQTALDAKANLVDIVGKQTIWLPAGAMTARTTTGAAFSTEELVTNDVMVRYWAFDATVSEAVQAMIRMPKGWNEGTLEVEFLWKHPATTVNFGVKWGVRARAISNDDAVDAAWGSEQEVADAGGTTADLYTTAMTAALTVGSTPAASDLVAFEFYRDPADAADTIAVDTHLIGVTVVYTIDAARDN